MPDMLVKLYDLPEAVNNKEDLRNQEIFIKRVLSPDKNKIIEYVRKNFNENWVNECDCSFSNNPISCFIAVKDKQVIGFACYDATAKNYFGPTGISEIHRGMGIGKALLLKCLLAMRENGYGYAIIGGADEAIKFYEKTVDASVIKGSVPGIYKRMIEIE